MIGILQQTLGSKALTTGFTYLEQNPAIQVSGVDLATMVIPRTTVDYQQNPDYGIETGIREAVSVLYNPFLAGVIANSLMAINGYSGVYVNNATLNSLHQAWKRADPESQFDLAADPAKKKIFVKKYAKEILKSASGSKKLQGWQSLSDKQLDFFAEELAEIILNGGKETKKRISELAARFTEVTNVSEELSVKGLGKEFTTSVNNLFRDSVSVGKKVFTSSIPSLIEEKVSGLGDLLKRRTGWGVGIAFVTAPLIQFVDRKLTELRTGEKGFVGYRHFAEDHPEKDNSDTFNIKKGLAVGGIALMTLISMGAFGKKGFFKPGGLKNFKDAMELKDVFPHMSVIRLVYASTVAGRLLAARDETELKTTTIRDYTGFMNWLVLGPFVAKGVANIFDRKGELFNGEIKGNNFFTKIKSWLEDISLKSTSELKAKFGNNTKKLALLNGARLSGLAYSLFALGIGMPYLLNRFIIDKSEKDQKQNLNTHSFSTFIMNNKEIYGNYKGLMSNG